MKKTTSLFATAIILFAAISAFGREARLVRYPHYHNGRVVFSYLGDIWTADENGQNIQRLTVNRARDVYGRFSPDGKWIAFSSDRAGNLDVFLIPAGGGSANFEIPVSGPKNSGTLYVRAVNPGGSWMYESSLCRRLRPGVPWY